MRRIVLAGGAVLVLGGSAVGIAAAQTAPTATPSGQQAQSGYQKFIDAQAKRLNVQPAALQTAIGQARTDAGLPAGNGFPGGERGGAGRGGVDLNAAATFLNVQPAQLRTELQTKTLAQVATDHGKTANDLANALKTAANTRIDQAVTAGRLTADQASQQKTQTAQRIDQLMTQTLPQGGPQGGRGGFGDSGTGLQAVQSMLNLTPQQLRTELQTKSLGQIASEHGSSPAAVATALKNAAHTAIDQAVTAGKLTADQAAQRKTQVDQRIDQQISQVMPQRGPGRGADNEDPNA